MDDPERWLVEASFRIYDSRKEPNVKKGITVTYWGKDIDQPILVAGKIIYISDKETKRPDHRDLWYLWFEENVENHESNGKIFKVIPQENRLKEYIKEAQEWFRLLRDIASFSKPIIILSGGEPLLREDVFDIITYGKSIGLTMTLST